MKLYELTEIWSNIQDMIETVDTDDEQIFAALENVEGAIEEKADNYAKIIFSMKAEAEAIKTEEKRLATKRQSLENRAKWLQKNLEEAMIATGKKKFKTSLFGFNIQKNPPSLKNVPDMDPKKLPEHYQVHTVSANSVVIKQALKDGQEVKGFWLEQGESLRIR